MGNCVACASPKVCSADAFRRPYPRFLEGNVEEDVPGVLTVRLPVEPSRTTSSDVNTKNRKRKAEELLHEVETLGMPLRLVLAHLLPGADNAIARSCYPPWRFGLKLGKSDIVVDAQLPAVADQVEEAKSRRQKAEEWLLTVETQRMPAEQEFALLAPDTDSAARRPQALESPTRLVKVEGVPVMLSVSAAEGRRGEKRAEEMLRSVETESLPLHQVFAHLLPDADVLTAVQRWRPALQTIQEVDVDV